MFAAALLAGTLLATPALADTTLKLVEVITSPPRTALLKKQVAAFEAANPGTHVEVTSLPWGQAFEKFLTMVQAGDTPDVVEMPDRWLGLYGNNAQLQDLGHYMAKWADAKDLGERAIQFGSSVGGKQYTLPYGYYLRAMFWNKALFKQAGLQAPPRTMDEFVADAARISKTPGKYGYCLRGGPGGFGGALMMMNSYDDKPGWFNPDGTSTFNEPGSVKGLQVLVDMYQHGSAPKDSVGWGFNEVVSGFYSGTCAMLDQDPDALLGIAGKMAAGDFGVAPLPAGPGGHAFPTLGYTGWSMFADSHDKDASWKLIAWLVSPENNLAWSKFVGTLPVYKTATEDPYFASDKFAGWFAELNDPKTYELVTPPSQLENLGNFYDNISLKSYQQALLGERTAKSVADEWAQYLTGEQKAYLAKSGK